MAQAHKQKIVAKWQSMKQSDIENVPLPQQHEPQFFLWTGHYWREGGSKLEVDIIIIIIYLYQQPQNVML